MAREGRRTGQPPDGPVVDLTAKLRAVGRELRARYGALTGAARPPIMPSSGNVAITL